jgi:hypothetical protein
MAGQMRIGQAVRLRSGCRRNMLSKCALDGRERRDGAAWMEGSRRALSASSLGPRWLWRAAAGAALLVLGYGAYAWGDEYSLNRRLVAESPDRIQWIPGLLPMPSKCARARSGQTAFPATAPI